MSTWSERSERSISGQLAQHWVATEFVPRYPLGAEVAIESHGSCAVLVLRGELDLASADVVRNALSEIERLGPQIRRGPRAVQRVFRFAGIECRLPFSD